MPLSVVSELTLGVELDTRSPPSRADPDGCEDEDIVAFVPATRLRLCSICRVPTFRHHAMDAPVEGLQGLEYHIVQVPGHWGCARGGDSRGARRARAGTRRAGTQRAHACRVSVDQSCRPENESLAVNAKGQKL